MRDELFRTLHRLAFAGSGSILRCGIHPDDTVFNILDIVPVTVHSVERVSISILAVCSDKAPPSSSRSTRDCALPNTIRVLFLRHLRFKAAHT